ncbi:MAG: hypothetical protein RXR06_12245 [Thermoproteus sp.]
MEVPKWIEIRDVFGVKLDPVTLIFRVPLNEILAIFSEDMGSNEPPRRKQRDVEQCASECDVTKIVDGRPVAKASCTSVER